MKTFPIACFLLIVACLALPALAQNPAVQPLSTSGTISPGELQPTPQMWFYEQYRQEYQDPKEAIHNRAVFRAEQRERRLASLKWYGFSPGRPPATSDPWNAEYWPSWNSNVFYPFRWSGYVSPVIVVHRHESAVHTY